MCDDGNRASGDGCSNLCEIEVGMYCINESPFTASMCGEGSMQFLDDGDGTSASVWHYVSLGTSGAFANDIYYRRHGTKGLRAYVNGGGSTSETAGYTWGQSRPATLSAGTTLRFHVSPQSDTSDSKSIGAVVRLVDSQSPPALSTPPSSSFTSFTICYNTGEIESGYCDQYIELPLYQYHAQVLNPLDLLQSKCVRVGYRLCGAGAVGAWPV